MPDITNTEKDSEYTPQELAKDLPKRDNYHQKIIQSFWKQWQKEYLTSLREQSSSYRNKPLSGETVAEEKLVLIHDDTPRNQWKLGIIVQLQHGKDGLVRSVTLKTAKGNLLSRPIEKLYPIEVSAEVIKDSHQDTQTEETSKTTRPIRIAAKQAAQRIKEILKLD